VLNATIDRFAYAFVSPRDDGQVLFLSNDRDQSHGFPIAAPQLPSSCLPLHAGVYEYVVRELNQGRPLAVTITTTVDVPPESGLGASSALTVALIGALQAYLGHPWDAYEAAQRAVHIERTELGLPGGRQDQHAAAFGGVNLIDFQAGGRVIVNPLRIPDDARNELEASLVVCHVAGNRDATGIIRQQIDLVSEGHEAVIEAFHRLKAGAFAIKDSILLGDIGGTAAILGASWDAKKMTATGVSTDKVERLCDIAARQGALASKISGAGGGGFLMFLIAPENRLGLINALNGAGGNSGPVKFTDRGCEAWRVRA